MYVDRSRATSVIQQLGDLSVALVANTTSVGARGLTGMVGAVYARPARVELHRAGHTSSLPVADIEGRIRMGALAVTICALLIRRIRR